MKEFREFAVRGNVINLAVAVIIGAAFGKVVASLFADIIMTLVSLLLGVAKFAELAAVVGGTEIRYGLFLPNVFDFLVIALVVFIMPRFVNRLRRKEEVEPASIPCPDRIKSSPRGAQGLLKAKKDIL